MEIHLYDQSHPGPPHGWIWPVDLSRERQKESDSVVAATVSALEADGSRESQKPGEAYWGCLDLVGRNWVYRIIPAGRDALGRPGRYLIAIFSAQEMTGMDWTEITRIQNELSRAVVNNALLAKLVDSIRHPQRENGFFDDILETAPSKVMSVIRDQLLRTAGTLSANGHVFIAFDSETGLPLRKQDSAVDAIPPSPESSSQPPKMPPPQPIKEAATTRKSSPQPAEKPRTSKCSEMKIKPIIITALVVATLALVVGFLAGSSLRNDGMDPREPSPYEFSDAAHALQMIREAADYLENQFIQNLNTDNRDSKPPYENDPDHADQSSENPQD